MLEKAVPAQVQEACEDLNNRTLVSLPGSFGRLIYLASMRDYNTGQYYHEGLANRFSEEVAAEALTKSHREAFQHLVRSPLAEAVNELERYIGSINRIADTNSIRILLAAEVHEVCPCPDVQYCYPANNTPPMRLTSTQKSSRTNTGHRSDPVARGCARASFLHRTKQEGSNLSGRGTPCDDSSCRLCLHWPWAQGG